MQGRRPGQKATELPIAEEVIPNIDQARMDPRKLHAYSMDPENPQNRNKAVGWRELGYDVDDPVARHQAADKLTPLFTEDLLPNGRVALIREHEDGTDYRVLNGFVGPNDRHATLVTGWRVDPGEDNGPRLLTTWLQVHRNEER